MENNSYEKVLENILGKISTETISEYKNPGKSKPKPIMKYSKEFFLKEEFLKEFPSMKFHYKELQK
jgi:hypothetical protein